MSLPAIAGLYAITPDTADGARLLAGVEAALAGGRDEIVVAPLEVGVALRTCTAGLDSTVRADGALLAARFEVSRSPQVERARRQLDNAGIPVLGTVINGMRSSEFVWRVLPLW